MLGGRKFTETVNKKIITLKSIQGEEEKEIIRNSERIQTKISRKNTSNSNSE